MTKTDYALIAHALHKARPSQAMHVPEQLAIATWTSCVAGLVVAFKHDPHFDSVRFVIECERGVSERSVSKIA